MFCKKADSLVNHLTSGIMECDVHGWSSLDPRTVATFLEVLLIFHFRYTRNLVDTGNGKFNLMILCWGEGHGSSIHDHANSHCFVKILDGTLRETMFAWPQDSEQEAEMSKIGVRDYAKDSVTYINGK